MQEIFLNWQVELTSAAVGFSDGVFLLIVGVLAVGGLYWWLFLVPRRDLKTHRATLLSVLNLRGWWQDHYVIVVIGVGLVMIAVAFHYYLIDIIRSVRLIVAQLVALLSETQTPAPADIATPSQIEKSGDPTAIRDLSYAIAVLLGVLVAASTVPFALIRVWINDRTINAAEQGLITDRINTAVTGLGVEKTVKQTAPDGTTTENTDTTHTQQPPPQAPPPRAGGVDSFAATAAPREPPLPTQGRSPSAARSCPCVAAKGCTIRR